MPWTRPAYPPELRLQILDLVRAGRTADSLAREFEPTETAIRNWIAQADREAGLRSDGLSADERAELNQLRREVRSLREEREILKKAAAWFAQETGATPRRPSATCMMVPTRLFNHRLKDAFMTAARNVVFYDPDSHLAGYYRNPVKAGMQPLEAMKRVARALVRVIFRELSALNESKANDLEQQKLKEGEGDMASGVTRGDQSRKSNISPSSLST